MIKGQSSTRPSPSFHSNDFLLPWNLSFRVKAAPSTASVPNYRRISVNQLNERRDQLEAVHHVAKFFPQKNFFLPIRHRSRGKRKLSARWAESHPPAPKITKWMMSLPLCTAQGVKTFKCQNTRRRHFSQFLKWNGSLHLHKCKWAPQRDAILRFSGLQLFYQLKKFCSAASGETLVDNYAKRLKIETKITVSLRRVSPVSDAID